jgi:hypothetical protein
MSSTLLVIPLLIRQLHSHPAPIPDKLIAHRKIN